MQLAEGADSTRKVGIIDEFNSDHLAGVWRYLRAVGCSSALAEDLTQDTFLAVLKRPFQHVCPAATSAYLRKTALSMLIAHVRREKYVRTVKNIELLDESRAGWARDDNSAAALDYLSDCIERLGARARLALDMRFRQGCTRSEIAAALEMTEHGAKNLMQRAKQQLRQWMKWKLSS